MVNIERRPRNFALTDFVQREIAAVRSGELNAFSPTSDLAQQFGYTSPDSVRQALRNAGLSKVISDIENHEALPPLTPSTDLAWITGFIAHRGSYDSSESLVIEEEAEEKRNAFLQSAQQITGFEAQEFVRGKKGPNKAIKIHGKILLRKLGDLTQRNFVKTFSDTYGWVLGDEEYLWNFLGGLVDSQGSFSEKSIRLYSTDEEFLNFILNCMNILAIPGAFQSAHQTDSKGYIGIFNARGLHFMGRNVQSRIPEIQDKLTDFGNKDSFHDKSVELMKTRERYQQENDLKLSLNKMSELRKKDAFPNSSKPYVTLLGDGSYPQAALALQIFDSLLQNHRDNQLLPSHNLITIAIELARRVSKTIQQSNHPQITGEDVGHFKNLLLNLDTSAITLEQVKNIFNECFNGRTITLQGSNFIIEEAKTVFKKTCSAHRWKIGEQNGARSLGVCRNCHAEKMFSNSHDPYTTESKTIKS